MSFTVPLCLGYLSLRRVPRCGRAHRRKVSLPSRALWRLSLLLPFLGGRRRATHPVPVRTWVFDFRPATTAQFDPIKILVFLLFFDVVQISDGFL